MEKIKGTIWRDRKRTFLGLPLSFTVYFLTKNKLITRKGFLSVVEDEIELYRVTDKKLLLPFGQRLVGCGTITIHVMDVDTPIKEIRCVKKVRRVMELLDKTVEDEKMRYNVRGRDMLGANAMDHDRDDDGIGDVEDAVDNSESAAGTAQ